MRPVAGPPSPRHPIRLGARLGLLAALVAPPAAVATEVESVWTTVPTRVVPGEPPRERLPPRQSTRAASFTLRVDAFPRLDAEVGFQAAGRRWRLAHVVLPPRNRLCRATDGRQWPCGVHAWAQVQGRLAGTRLTCARPPADAPPIPSLVCDRNGRPLAETLVASGWVLLAEGAPPRLLDLATDAITERRGIWALDVPIPDAP